MSLDKCSAAKIEGNAAFASGELEKAVRHYDDALTLWEASLSAFTQPKSLAIGDKVRYPKAGGNRFGMIMGAYPVMDEYFLKDLGDDQAVWQGDAGGQLRRFEKKDLQLLSSELLDLWLACTQNLAAVYLKQGEPQEAIKWADAALATNGRASKALFRKGAALLQGPALEETALAVEVLTLCKEVDPKNKEVARLLRQAEIKRGSNWICVMGCCGPWGIVCGGPIALDAVPTIAPGVVKAIIQHTTSVTEATENTDSTTHPLQDTDSSDDDDEGDTITKFVVGNGLVCPPAPPVDESKYATADRCDGGNSDLGEDTAQGPALRFGAPNGLFVGQSKDNSLDNSRSGKPDCESSDCSDSDGEAEMVPRGGFQFGVPNGLLMAAEKDTPAPKCGRSGCKKLDCEDSESDVDPMLNGALKFGVANGLVTVPVNPIEDCSRATCGDSICSKPPGASAECVSSPKSIDGTSKSTSTNAVDGKHQPLTEVQTVVASCGLSDLQDQPEEFKDKDRVVVDGFGSAPLSRQIGREGAVLRRDHGPFSTSLSCLLATLVMMFAVAAAFALNGKSSE